MLTATPYAEVQLNSLYAGNPNPFNGETPLNARRVDLNADQRADLLFPNRVLLQRAGRYFPDESIDIPDHDQGPALDVFGDTLYLKFPTALKAYRYREDAWEVVFDMEMQWPYAVLPDLEESPAPEVSPDEKTEDMLSASFERFVYDIDQDGTPELLFPLQDGLHIYHLREEHYVALPVLNIFPKTKLIPLEEALPTSNLDRSLTFPDQHLVFHCSIDEGIVTLLTKQGLSDGSIQFTEYRHELTKTDEGFIAKPMGDPIRSAHFPSYIQPCRLNPDASIDYAGGELDYTSSLALLTPIYTSTVQTSPEAPSQTFRTKSFSPHVLLSDFNHDGYADLMLARTDITNGGLRETLNRFTTQRTFSHGLYIHFQQADGRFSTTPDVQKTITIKLDQTPIRLGDMFERYQGGKLLNVTGDFNHDTINDLLVQTSPDTLSLYLCDGTAFSANPYYTIPVKPYETFQVLDLNRDGFSDIVLQGTPENEADSSVETRVLLFNVEPIL